MRDPAALPPEQSRFLAGTPYAGWTVEPMPGDADVRRYWRLAAPDDSAILMDMTAAAPAAFEAFCAIGAHLRTHGLAAPAVRHAVKGTAMLVLEDFGTTTLARAAAEAPDREATLYRAATEAMLAVQGAPPPPGLGVLTPEVGGGMLAPLFEWYCPRAPGAETLESAMADALERHAGPAERLSLRDYFSENLMWREDRAGTGRIGLLDFQDAFVAPAAYDLASLLRDARRDVAPEAVEAAMGLFVETTGTDRAAADRAVAVLSVQRNLRILGIFARLARRDGKTRYLPMLPRVRAHVLADVAHPALAALRRPVEAALSARPFV